MKLVKNPVAPVECRTFRVEELSREVTSEDHERFMRLVSVDLDRSQIERIVTPEIVYRRQEAVLAVHWHPEFVPLDLIRKRIQAMFPDSREDLVIPTQHNEIMAYGPYSGVEVDCYSRGFNRKVQLLLHFTNQRVEQADVLKSMIAHTQKYRSSQLFDFMHTITKPDAERIEAAAQETGADAELIKFVQVNVEKIKQFVDQEWERIPPISLKNKLLRNWFNTFRPELGENTVNRVQAFLKAVKVLVKADFSLKYFYRASEVIEEVRALGGCVVIPHPEQFWPILLADYDVDGIEVWNPQSREYTEFLISVVNEHNRRLVRAERRLLILMGDDCHMGEKTLPPGQRDEVKAAREIGVQPAWDDLSIQKRLIVNKISRESVIREYRERLDG